jgi:phosphoglycolate phosphatase-like HAD superfamily hydrolase
MSKKILIFDMDGVLLKPKGYHRALKETVRLGAQALGYEGISLTDEDIAQFEGLSISSEWHSSAACMALLAISGKLDLELLFASIKREPIQNPARLRLERSIQSIAKVRGVNPSQATSIIRESQSVEWSATFRIFQELILGSDDFARIYKKKGELGVESYLLQFDQPLLRADIRERLISWQENPKHKCVVMTNRPSRRMPDAEYGLRLVGLDDIPLVGNNDIEWLADQVDGKTAMFLKPSPVHALAAVFAALGKNLGESLMDAYGVAKGDFAETASFLDGSQIWIFEDSPAGIISVGEMGELLRKLGISVAINKVGIATMPLKSKCLEKQGALVFDGIHSGLEDVF